MATSGHLLFADDEEIFLLATADLLREQGFHVDCARNATEARDFLDRQAYDVLISDIRMPGNPGLELLKDIPGPNTGIPVILVTGFPSMSTALEAMGCAVLGYLLKPLDFQELLGLVRKGVGLRRLQSIAQESSQRFQQWADEMKAFSAEVKEATPGLGVMPINGLMGLVLGNIASSTLDLKRLFEISLSLGQAPGVCQIEDCPRMGLYENVIRQGIETIERTKGAFKSRELADLRKKFQALLEPPVTAL
jgi:DNA-binding NarL/FixJ family response regulator